MIFEKDYSSQIQNLWEAENATVKQLNKNTEQLDKFISLFNSLQEQVMALSFVQGQHKEIITFLMRNITFDSDKTEDVQKELLKMLKNIRETEDKLKK